MFYKHFKRNEIRRYSIYTFLLHCKLFQLYTESTGKSGFSTGGHYLSNLGYTDDIMAVNDFSQEIQKFINIFTKDAKEVDLIINQSAWILIKIMLLLIEQFMENQFNKKLNLSLLTSFCISY